MTLLDRVKHFARNDEAQDLIEYALLVGLISLVAIAALTLTGSSVNTLFQNIESKLAIVASA